MSGLENSVSAVDQHSQSQDQQELIDLFHSALKNKSADDLSELLDRGLDPNAKETIASPGGRRFERHLLEIALLAGSEEEVQPLMKVLLDAGADPKQAVRYDGETLLMKAISARRFEMARILIEHGDDVNAANNVGWTVVHAACTRGEDELQWLEMLEAAGANMDVATNGGATPLLSIACDPVRLRWMLERVPHRINDHDDRGETVLLRAIEYRGAEGVRIAIEYGADLGSDSRNENGVDALEYARLKRDSTIKNADAGQAAAMNEIVKFLEAVKAAKSASEIVAKIRARGDLGVVGGSSP